MKNKKAIIIVIILVLLAGGASAFVVLNKDKFFKADNTAEKPKQKQEKIKKEETKNDEVSDDFEGLEDEYVFVDRSTFESTLENYTKYLNSWNYKVIKNMTLDVRGEEYNRGAFWKGLEGSVKSTDIIEEKPEYKFIKIVLDIKNPGVTALKEGINEKYIFIARADKEREDYWSVSPMVDDPKNLNVEYEKYYDFDDDGYTLTNWQTSLNNGLGYKYDEDRYMAGMDLYGRESVTLDLNNDGNEDVITIEDKFYVNKGKDNEAYYDDIRKLGNTYRIYDFDKNDNYKDIVCCGYSKTIVLRYNGKELYEFGSVYGDFDLASKDDTEFTLSGSVGMAGFKNYPVKVTKDGFEYTEEWAEALSHEEPMVVAKKIALHTKPDNNSDTVEIESGTYLYPKRFKLNISERSTIKDDDIWAEYEYDDGKIVYVHYIDNSYAFELGNEKANWSLYLHPHNWVK